MFSLSNCLIRLFSRISIHFMSHAVAAHATEKAALEDMATTYRGSSQSGQRYWKTIVSKVLYGSMIS